MLFQKRGCILALLTLLSPALLSGQTRSKDAVWTRLDTKELETLGFSPFRVLPVCLLRSDLIRHELAAF